MEMETKNCEKCDKNFEITVNDLNFYQKIKVPSPTLCPECRYIRRLLDRNEYNFYKRKCDATGKDIISIYREDAPFPVYAQEYWKSDKFEGRNYGRDFDFSRPFFEQYEDLRRVVPHLALVNSNSVNSEYTNQSQDNKDCYMLVTSGSNEKCVYGSWCQNSHFLGDCYMAFKSEFCYECININHCSKCIWCQDCSDSVELKFCIDSRGCVSCFGCVGLREKSYHWFNEPLTKEEYEENLKKLKFDVNFIKESQQKLKKLRLSLPVKYFHGSQIQNSTGDYLEDCARTRLAFNCKDNKDVAYMQDAWLNTEDCLDCTEIINGELSYEAQGVETPHRSMIIRSCFNTIVDSYYCDMCFGVSDCLGCFGLKKSQYCILNKQYTKEEYFSLKEKIIEHMRQSGEWGEYFPPKVSPFAYNESMAQDYFPLSKEEVLKQGYNWYDRLARSYEITEGVYKCATQDSPEKQKYPLCTTAFRTTLLELSLYKILNLPIPEKCFPCRRQDRFKLRNPRKLWPRKCMKAGCPNEFETSYAPDRPEIIYCERCYQQEVY